MSQELSGWRRFSAIIFALVGAFNVIGGLAALFKDEVYAVGEDGLLITDYTAWGWFLLVLGVLQLAVAVGVFGGRRWAVLVGVLLASLSGMLHIAFLVAFPAFGVITIALSVLVVYGLIVPDEQTP